MDSKKGKRRIAVTGGIAMGKSAIIGIAEEFGLESVSADDIAREVLDDSKIQEEIAKISGLETPIDRDVLRAAIGADSNLRRATNGIMHPEIIAKLRASDADMFEIPLLIESCLQNEFDEIWVASCPAEVQFERLMARLGNADEAQRLIDSQLPIAVKEVFADKVIRTNRPLSSVRDDIKSLLRVE